MEEAPARFDALGLDEALAASVAALGYEEPTPIQRAAIPPLLAGRDLLGQAATGTGKTAAFALPLLQRVKRDGVTRALVLVPTRELAMQVAQAVERYGKALDVSVLAIYGGASMVTQVRALQRGVTVVVATPGRALDHLRRKTLRLDGVEMLVLDEADEMLDMGFAEDLEAILTATPATRQTALFSATLPPRIVAIGSRHMRDPVRIAIAHEKLPAGALPRVRQTAYVVARAHKPAALRRLLDVEAPPSAIVFCRTRNEVDELSEALSGGGHRAEALHGGLSQEQRDRVMKRFRSGNANLLVATDVAARGLDIEHVSHVVNYDVPSEPEDYVHRIGRTGRAGREGVALTLTEPREQRLLRNIEAVTRQRIEVAPVPTAKELRARRLERIRGALRETILAGSLEEMRGVVDALATELDLADVAAAAVMLVHRARGGDAPEADIPVVRPVVRPPVDRSATKPMNKLARPGAAREVGKPSFGKVGGAPARSATSNRPEGGKRGVSAPGAEVTRLYIGAGREGGVRPADLVGAIANEAGIPSRSIGAIQVGDRYSIVEVPEAMADAIIEALRKTRIKGNKVIVRRDRSP